MIKIVTIVGARPQFIKASAVSRAIKCFNKRCSRAKPKIKEILIHTGQHYDYSMSDIFFKDLGLKKPDYNLGVGSGFHGAQTAMMLERIEPVLKREGPDFVLVYGDTNSTLAGALAAAKLNIALAHIEAGLRSFDKGMPEEINRVLTDRISSLLFCPTQTAVDNLANEGIYKGVFKVGDVMLDVLLFYLKIAEARSNILEAAGIEPKQYCLATIHRQYNTDNPGRLSCLMRNLNKIAEEKGTIIFPLHLRTKKALQKTKFTASINLRLMDPVSYLDMLVLERNASAIFTDSGGVQKEAYFLKIPCLTLRDETEWIETLRGGWNKLVGTDIKKIDDGIRKRPLNKNYNRKIYGTGCAADKIVRIITKK